MLVFKPFYSHLSHNICMISLGLGCPLLGYEQYSCLISSKTSKTLNITALTLSHITPVIVMMVRNTEISFLLLVLHNLSSHQNPAEYFRLTKAPCWVAASLLFQFPSPLLCSPLALHIFLSVLFICIQLSEYFPIEIVV